MTGAEVAPLATQIRGAAGRHPEVPVIFHSADRPDDTTLAALWADAERIATGLQERGVGPGDVVAMQLPAWRESAVLPAAVWLCGAALLPIVSIYGPREVGFILRQSGASVFVGARRWRGADAADLLAGLPELPDLAHTFVVGEPLPGVPAFDDLHSAGAPVETVVDVDDVSLVVYTSGTTADPKGVRHTHRTLHAEVHNTTALDAGADNVYLSAFPPGHIGGVLCLLRTIMLATPTVSVDVWDPLTAARLIERHRVTASSGVPIFLHGLLDAAAEHAVDLSSLRTYLTGAANVSPGLIRRADRHGVAAFRSYGSSEHPTVSSGTPGDPLEKRATTDGRPTPGTELRLVDGLGEAVGPGVDGEILTRGPERFAGYTDMTLQEASFVDGWFRTGDIGRLDVDGYLTITDRKKDLIIRGGENISSKEIEDILSEHPSVAEVAAIGAQDERYGERVCVCVVLRPGASLDLAGVQEHFRLAGTARQKTPERLILHDALPRTAAGKVQKAVLRAGLPT